MPGTTPQLHSATLPPRSTPRHRFPSPFSVFASFLTISPSVRRACACDSLYYFRFWVFDHGQVVSATGPAPPGYPSLAPATCCNEPESGSSDWGFGDASMEVIPGYPCDQGFLSGVLGGRWSLRTWFLTRSLQTIEAFALAARRAAESNPLRQEGAPAMV